MLWTTARAPPVEVTPCREACLRQRPLRKDAVHPRASTLRFLELNISALLEVPQLPLNSSNVTADHLSEPRNRKIAFPAAVPDGGHSDQGEVCDSVARPLKKCPPECPELAGESIFVRAPPTYR